MNRVFRSIKASLVPLGLCLLFIGFSLLIMKWLWFGLI